MQIGMFLSNLFSFASNKAPGKLIFSKGKQIHSDVIYLMILEMYTEQFGVVGINDRIMGVAKMEAM